MEVNYLHPTEALRRTLFEFDLSAAELSRKAKLTESQISDYKKGKKDLNTESWLRLIHALPEDARCYYLDLIFDLRQCLPILDSQSMQLIPTKAAEKTTAYHPA